MIALTLPLLAFADKGNGSSGGGDAFILNENNFSYFVENILKDVLTFRIENLSEIEKHLLKDQYALDFDRLKGELEGISFRSQGISNGRNAIVLTYDDSATSYEVLQRALAQFLISSLDVDMTVVHIDQLLSAFYRGSDETFSSLEEIKNYLKSDEVRAILMFRAYNINDKLFELLPEKLGKKVATLSAKQIVSDIKRSRYSFQNGIFVDGVQKDAMTKHKRNAKVLVDVDRLFQRGVNKEQMLSLLFHEHMRHFDVDDTKNEVSILIDRRYMAKYYSREDDKKICHPRKQATDYGQRILYAILQASPIEDKDSIPANIEKIKLDADVRTLGGLFVTLTRDDAVKYYQDHTELYDWNGQESDSLLRFVLSWTFNANLPGQNLHKAMKFHTPLSNYHWSYDLTFDEVFCK